jgi:riboflavin kinase/FMN adenylyltransferase
MVLNKGFHKSLTDSIVALGFFDGVHIGHQAVLNRAAVFAQENKKHLRIVTFYPHPRNFIGHHPSVKYLTTYIEKYRLLQKLYPGCEVFYIRFDKQLRHTNPIAFLCLLCDWFEPLAVFTGENFRFGYKAKGNSLLLQSFFQKRGVAAAIIPSVYQSGNIISSTIIRQHIENGDISHANAALGYSFTIRGRIIKGKKIGSQIGFPTANLYPSSSKIIPPHGVYFGTTDLEGVEYPSLVYIGTKPSIVVNQRPIVEVHIPHWYHQYLYQERVNVNITRFWRKEIVFPSLDALKEQIAVDQAAFDAYLQHTQGMINYHLNGIKLEV